ncbi:SpoIID/LytB domain-containing protein [Cellulosilyticum sp. I15G10I2]|uniref:SpoIID/LytB domain-containing protein n=1 Tax=Cellulosilyticum sp. I15G10I2 TaxID=1892843 RepID=UPI00085C32CC|nr:SpoIID/LytB domain-containing protein [Cellulosilyticum sp. I15G10I2]
MDKGLKLKSYYKIIMVLGVYCFCSSILFAAVPTTVKIGLESIYKDASSIYISSQNNLQIGYLNDHYFQVEGTLNTNSVSVVKTVEDYYFTGITYYTYMEADNAAKAYGNGAVAAYLAPGTYCVYIKDYNDKLLAAPASYTRIALYNAQNELVFISENNTEPLLLQGSENGYSFPITQVGNSRKYRGAIGVVNGQIGGLTALNTVDLEEYLYGVIPGEMPASWPQEALKTQAVAARSIAVFQYNRFINRGYNLVDTTLCQVYRGFSAECASTNAAVDATRGEVIKYNNKVAEALYSSTSGGVTEDAKYVWGNEVPYLKAVSDSFETEPAQKPWIRTITLSEINSVLMSQGINIGNLQGLEITSRTPAGRVQVLTFIGASGTHTIKNENVRTFFSSTKEGSLKSRLFSFSGFIGTPTATTPSQTVSVMSVDNIVQKNITAITAISSSGIEVLAGNPVVQSAQDKKTLSVQTSQGMTSPMQSELIFGDITVYGQGFGHGVGMSQSGAMGMAKAGYNYIEILKHYYSGVTVER